MNESLGTLEASASPPPAEPPTSRRRWLDVAPALLALVAVALVVVAALVALIDEGRLPHEGDRWWGLVPAAIVVLVAAGFLATRRRRVDAQLVAATVAAEGTRRGRWGRIPRLVAWALVLGWVVTTVGVVTTAERSRSFGDLESAIRQGDVDEVGVAGDLGLEARGQQLAEVHWRSNGLAYRADVQQVRERRPRAGGFGQGIGNDSRVTGRISGDVTSYLSELDPSVRVVPASYARPGTEFNMFGWQIIGWLMWPWLALIVMTLRVLAVSPEPWHSTRWAWFWLTFLLAPLGPLLFLLMGGPSGAVRRASPRRKRFTGGWAFLLGLLLSSFW